MAWRISVTVPDSRLVSAMNAVAKVGKVEVERIGMLSEQSEAPVNGAPSGSVFISIGPKTPKIGTVADKLVRLVERLEGRVGAHNVTRRELNEAIKHAKMSDAVLSSGVTTAIQNGYLAKRES